MKSIPFLFALLGALVLFGCVGSTPPSVTSTAAPTLVASSTAAPDPTVDPLQDQVIRQVSQQVPLSTGLLNAFPELESHAPESYAIVSQGTTGSSVTLNALRELSFDDPSFTSTVQKVVTASSYQKTVSSSPTTFTLKWAALDADGTTQQSVEARLEKGGNAVLCAQELGSELICEEGNSDETKALWDTLQSNVLEEWITAIYPDSKITEFVTIAKKDEQSEIAGRKCDNYAVSLTEKGLSELNALGGEALSDIHGSLCLDAQYGFPLLFAVESHLASAQEEVLEFQETHSVPDTVPKLGVLPTYEGGFIDGNGEYAYFGISTTPAQVLKIKLDDFSFAGMISLQPGEDFVTRVVGDNQYIYVGTYGGIVRVRQHDLKRMDKFAGSAASLVIDTKKEYLYAGARSTNVVWKIRLADFKREDSDTIFGAYSGLTAGTFGQNDEYLFFGTWSQPGEVIKVKASDLQEIDRVQLGRAEAFLGEAWADDEFAYFEGGAGTKPTVTKIKQSDMSVVRTLALGPAQGSFTTAAVDSKKEFAYLGTNTAPGRVVKVQLDILDRVNSVVFEEVPEAHTTDIWKETRIGGIHAAVIDPNNEYLYVGSSASWEYKNPMILKIRLKDFNRVGLFNTRDELGAARNALQSSPAPVLAEAGQRAALSAQAYAKELLGLQCPRLSGNLNVKLGDCVSYDNGYKLVVGGLLYTGDKPAGTTYVNKMADQAVNDAYTFEVPVEFWLYREDGSFETTVQVRPVCYESTAPCGPGGGFAYGAHEHFVSAELVNVTVGLTHKESSVLIRPPVARATSTPTATPTATATPTPTPSPTATLKSCQWNTEVVMVDVKNLPSETYQMFQGEFVLSNATSPTGYYSQRNSPIPADAKITSVYIASPDQGYRSAGGCANVYVNGQEILKSDCTVCAPPNTPGHYCGIYGFQVFGGPLSFSEGVALPVTFSGSVSSDGYSNYANIRFYATVNYLALECAA